MQHDLFLELEAFNPRWQIVYASVGQAAKAAKVLPMFQEWLLTEEGKHYQEIVRDVPDYEANNAAERRMREALLARAPIGGSNEPD